MTLETIEKRVAAAWLVNTALYSEGHTAYLQQYVNAAFKCSDTKIPMKPVCQVLVVSKASDGMEGTRLLRLELENIIAAQIEMGCDVAIEKKDETTAGFCVYAYR